MGSLKELTIIIMGSKCNYVSIPKGTQQDLKRITVGGNLLKVIVGLSVKEHSPRKIQIPKAS